MTKWIIRVKGHPYVINSDYMFKNMAKMEEFVGEKDIQIDHIDKIVRLKDGKETSFLCESKECISSTRMILVKKRGEKIRRESCHS